MNPNLIKRIVGERKTIRPTRIDYGVGLDEGYNQAKDEIEQRLKGLVLDEEKIYKELINAHYRFLEKQISIDNIIRHYAKALKSADLYKLEEE